MSLARSLGVVGKRVHGKFSIQLAWLAPIGCPDQGKGARCTPPVMETNATIGIVHQPFLGDGSSGRITTMAIDDHDTTEAAALHAVEQVAHDGAKCLHAQRHAAWKGLEVGREAEGHRREDRHAQRFSRFDSDPLGKDHVDRERKAGMLFDAADRQHATIVVA